MRLALSITHSDGTVTRWGGDEPDASDIPRGLKFGTVLPGGFKDLTCSLPRRIDIESPDLHLFDSVRAYGPGNETAWEGRQQQFPRQQATDFSVDVGAVGHSAALTDNGGFREIYVDRDFASWGDIPIARKLVHSGSGVNIGRFSWEDGPDALSLAYDAVATNVSTLAETAYQESALKLAGIFYQGAHTSFPTGFIVRIEASATEDHSSGTDTYTPTLDNSFQFLSLTTPRQYLTWYVYSNGATTTPAAGALTRIPLLAVYGNHGVPLRAIAGEPHGVYASDVIADILTRAAPGLTFTTGAAGSIQPTTYQIPQLVFLDPVTASDALQLVNGYHLYNWAVWDRKTFYYRPPDSSTDTIWEARISEGAQIQLEGDQATDLYNGVVVTYTDPLGRNRAVGPPGSATDAQSSTLESTDPLNPVNAAGLTRWATVNLSVPTSDAGAIQLGAVWLAEHSLPQRRGQIALTGTATCIQTGWRNAAIGARPAWAVRAGDWIRIADLEADEPRQIIETSYDHDARTVTLSIGTTPFKLDAILERVTSDLVGKL